MKIYKSTIFPLLIILSLISAIFFAKYVPILQYADEIVTILLLSCIIMKFLKRNAFINKYIRNIICLFVIITLIGIISTVINKVQPNKFAVYLDMLTMSKIVICPLGMYFLLNEYNSDEIIKILTPVAKFFLCSGLICAIVSQFINIGMTEYARGGIKSFYFTIGFQHLFSILVLCALLIILSKKFDFRYVFIAIVQMMLTLKGPSIIWSVSIMFILYYFKKDRKKISKWVYVVLLIFCIVFGQFQIQNYFLNDTAPRVVLLNYGLKTALTYFPLGSGFATYGSPVAANYYSPLYQLYGFNNKFGMSKMDTSFLNDNYWPTILGQFGFFGLIIALVIFVNFFNFVMKSKLRKDLKAVTISCLFFIAIHSLGSSIFTTNATLLLFMIIVVIIKMDNIKVEEQK